MLFVKQSCLGEIWWNMFCFGFVLFCFVFVVIKPCDGTEVRLKKGREFFPFHRDLMRFKTYLALAVSSHMLSKENN